MPIKELPLGCDWRGFKFRAYPTEEQVTELRLIQEKLQRIWNSLVSDASNIYYAREAAAVRAGVVKRLAFPDYNGLDPEQAHAKRVDFRRHCKERRVKITAWSKGNPAVAYRNRKEARAHFGVKHDYQWAMAMAGLMGEVPALLVTSLVKDYDFALSATKRGQRPPKRKKRPQDIGVRTRSGKGCIAFGQFGPRPGMPNGRPDWLNAQIKLPGVSRISCRVGPEQAEILNRNCLLEGVSLREEADGWYASIRHAVKAPQLPEPTELACGLDMGLLDLAAVVGTDGEERIVKNPRNGRGPKNYIEQMALRQAAELPINKMACRAARNVRQVAREWLVAPLGRYRYIFVEKLSPRIGQMGSHHQSYMRGAAALLKSVYGDRVREVDPSYTSQDCSQCGFRSKDTWSCDFGRVGVCPECGHSEHRDLNAARNILAKGLRSLDT